MSSWLVGADIDQGDMDKLRLQGNTAWGGCGSPLCMVAFEAINGRFAEAELPPMPGLRRVVCSGHALFPGVGDTGLIDIEIRDDDGVLGTLTIDESDYLATGDIEWTRPTTGRIIVDVGTVSTGDGKAQLTISPRPPTLSVSGMEGDGYMHTDRTGTDADLGQRLFGIWYEQTYGGWRRPQVNTVIMDPGISDLRYGAGTSPLRATLPIYSRGHKIGMSAQGVNTVAGAPELRLKVDGETLVTLGVIDAFPGAQGTIIRGTSTNPLPAGYTYCDLEVYVPVGGGLDLHSVAVYEEVS